jgi:phenylpyruvate tautomerase PptA (4-oxalocrotonate tautomerase family)
MPMIDAYIPEGALEANTENRLLEDSTDILIKHEGLDPADQRVRAVTWILLHRPKIYRAGTAARQAVYRITPAVPEGQYTDEARASLVKEVTEAVARAERRGSRGANQRLPDIMAYFGGEPMRELGIQRLEAKRRRDITAVREAIVEMVRRADVATTERSRGSQSSHRRCGGSSSLR